MRTKAYIRYKGSAILLVLALSLFLISLLVNNLNYDSEKVARRLEKRINAKINTIENYAEESINANSLDLSTIPELSTDIVIYKYIYDSLIVWKNQFPIKNDDIKNKLLFQNLHSLSSALNSPLMNISSEIQYLNLGTKWYLTKAISNNYGTKIIFGLEIKDILNEDSYESRSGLNPHLKLGPKYDISPINSAIGIPIIIDDVPILKLQTKSNIIDNIGIDSILRWFAVLFLSIAVVLYLWKKRTIKLYLLTILYFIGLTIFSYNASSRFIGINDFFSPTIYANGSILFSIGILIIFNIIITLLVFSTYSIRDLLKQKIYNRGKKYHKILYLTLIITLLIGLFVYISLTFKSVIMNSSIEFELYRLDEISIYTIIVYSSYLFLLFSCHLLSIMVIPIIRKTYNTKIFTQTTLVIFSLFVASYFTISTVISGKIKEDNKATIWANRLSVDRDLSTEIRLRAIENRIVSSASIATLVTQEQDENIIRNRLLENYLSKVSEKYFIKASIFSNSKLKDLEKINNLILSGTTIAPHSNFTHLISDNNRSCYLGHFIYYSEQTGVSHLILALESKSNREYTGYQKLLKSSININEVKIPNYYSYGKYINEKLVSYNGNYPYPNIINGTSKEKVDNGSRILRLGGYIHYINNISTTETIFISRRERGVLNYFITFSYLMLFSYFFFYFLTSRNKQRFKKNYFRARISFILFTSLSLTLIIMATICVIFIYNRNEVNLNEAMSQKIITIQKMLERSCNNLNNYKELSTNEYSKILEKTASTLKTDITLFSPEGKIFKTTAPDIIDNSLLGSRINNKAYNKITNRHDKYYIKKLPPSNNSFYLLYAPIRNSNGDILAIVNAPYTEESSSFNRDASFHAATIISLFLILLGLVLFIGKTVINALFEPLIIMGQKMRTANLQSLELIEYQRDDEISSVIEAYNRMATDLSNSSKQLAQAERDKAWSEMARQVAHEIKNPLTPIKLEIQRLIRLKERNDSSWSKKFDNVSKIILEHIDILTDTANEFSTFAKLYTEDPILINLDKVIKEQIMIFDNRDNIQISYYGLDNSMILAPKPQLIRVLVNLITNAIQAVEATLNNEELDSEKSGKVIISLRNSIEEGYYDIVIDDSGEGVKEENQSKLFTPNFTTKSGGTGLGLAICRNIIEKCKGSITYKKSHILSGACFTVHLPRTIQESSAESLN